LAALAGALIAPASATAVAVYHSERDDGLPIGSGVAEFSGRTLVHVYFNNGDIAPAGGSECAYTPAASDEICQWAVRLTTTGDLVIVDVAWGGSALEDDEPTAPATERDGTGGDAANGELGRTKLATVALTGTHGELRLFTPDGPPDAPGAFGFIGEDGGLPMKISSPGVLLAEGGRLPWSSVSANTNRSCGALGNGEIRCWGTGGGGTLPTGTAFRQVATGEDFACALDFGNTASCWSGSSPPSLTGEYLQLAAGSTHICALTSELMVECVGTLTVTPGVDPEADGPFKLVSRGDDFACALGLDGAITDPCFGSAPPAVPADPPPYIDLAGGWTHVCGLLGDGIADCWGTGGGATVPVLLEDVEFTEISAADTYTCAIRKDDGTVECWGTAPSSIPSGAFAALSAASGYACGTRAEGNTECWGTVPGAASVPEVPFPQVAAGAPSNDVKPLITPD
jgi:hypothetical protein